LEILAVDLDDPRVREGLRITAQVLTSMRAELARSGARLIVVLLHNKPYNYSNLMRAYQPDIDPVMFALIDKEQVLTDVLEEFLRDERIPFVDTGAAVQAEFGQNREPYPESDDHHLNAVGYRAVATAVLSVVSADTNRQP
jgi:hypothetical protein